MTTYFVDPVNGNNASNGLSWGNAWRWVPGNGATVNPGDEIRFAKSAERAPASAYPIQVAGIGVTNTPPGYQAASVSGTWVLGGGGGTIGTSGSVTFTAGTVVPANTKLMYVPFSRTQTTLNGYEAQLRLVNIPTSAPGGNLRVVLCSDAAGNTPIRTLAGPTWLNPDGTGCFVSYLFNQAGTLNDTIGSIAVYSISSFTIPAGNTGRIDFGEISGQRNLYITPDQTLSGTHFLRRGDAVKLATPMPLAMTLAAPRNDIYQLNGTNSQSHIIFPPPRRSAASSFTHFSTFTHYSALPFQLPAVYEAPITYAGNSGSRIKLSGGWNTSSGLQDGYTNLAIQQLTDANRKGWFVFSSGGQYIDFERFICIGCNLVYYDFNLTAINGLRFYDCIVGMSRFDRPPTWIAAPAITSPVPVDAWYMERCTALDWFGVSKGNCFQAFTGNAEWQPTDFTFGSIDLVDCFFSTFAGRFSGNIACSGDITIRGSVNDSGYRTVLLNTGGGTMRPTSAFTGTFTIKDTISNHNSLNVRSNSAGAANTGKFVARNLGLCDSGTGGTAQQITFITGDYAEITLDGYAMNNSMWAFGGRPLTAIYVTNTDGLYTNNPSGFLKIGGPVGSAVSTTSFTSYNHDGVEITFPPSTLDLGSPVRPWSLDTGVAASPNYPGLVIANWSGNLTVQNFVGSYIHFKTPTYTAGTYWPSVPQAVVQNCDCRVSTDAPIGVVRAYGGVMRWALPYQLAYTTPSCVPPAMLVYGAEIDNVYDQNISGTTSSNQEKRQIGVGLLGTGIKYGYINSTNFQFAPKQLHIEESASMLDPAANTIYSDYRGLQVRNQGGGFMIRRSNKHVRAVNTKNDYDKRDVYFDAKTGMNIARLDVFAGTMVQLNLRTRCVPAVTNQDWFQYTVIIPPCTAYSTEISGHYFRKNFVNNTDDFLQSINIAPTADGEVYINLFAYCALILKDFSADVV